MEKQAERKLLYYDYFQKIPRHYNGEPIFHFIYKDVKTGENFTLSSCYFAEEISKLLGEHYYENIIEATQDYDILWNISSGRISPIADTFEKVQSEYKRMLIEGVAPEEINSAMMTLFQEKKYSKKR